MIISCQQLYQYSKIKRDLPEVDVWLEFFLVTSQEQRSYMRSMRMLASQSWTRVCTEKDEERRSWVGSPREGGHVTPSFLTGDEKEFQSNIDFR